MDGPASKRMRHLHHNLKITTRRSSQIRLKSCFIQMYISVKFDNGLVSRGVGGYVQHLPDVTTRMPSPVATSLLELPVPTTPEARMSVCNECGVFSGSLCDGPIPRPEESYRATPPKARMSVSNECCVFSGSLCDGPIPRPEESYRARVCVSVCVLRCSNSIHLQ